MADRRSSLGRDLTVLGSRRSEDRSMTRTGVLEAALALACSTAALGIHAEAFAQPNPDANPTPGTGQPPTAGYSEAPASPSGPPAAGGPASTPPTGPASPGAAPPPAAPAQPASNAAQPAERPPPQANSDPPPNYQASSGYGAYEPPPPPPPREPGKIPSFSVRVDPLNALIAGRMGLELEVQLWRFITFETVPTFVVWQEPPSFNLAERDTNLRQESNGIGALSGASLGLGFWLEGKAFSGYVLKAILTNHAYRYVSYSPSTGAEIDNAPHVERVLQGFFGSYSRIGKVFTIGAGIGIGVELNREKRCFEGAVTSSNPLGATNDCPKNQFLIALNPSATSAGDLNGGLYPVYLQGRISLGFVIDP